MSPATPPRGLFAARVTTPGGRPIDAHRPSGRQPFRPQGVTPGSARQCNEHCCPPRTRTWNILVQNQAQLPNCASEQRCRAPISDDRTLTGYGEVPKDQHGWRDSNPSRDGFGDRPAQPALTHKTSYRICGGIRTRNLRSPGASANWATRTLQLVFVTIGLSRYQDPRLTVDHTIRPLVKRRHRAS